MNTKILCSCGNVMTIQEVKEYEKNSSEVNHKNAEVSSEFSWETMYDGIILKCNKCGKILSFKIYI